MGTVRTTAILVLVTGYAIFFSPLGCKKTTSLKGIGEKCGQSSECKSGLVCIDFACQLATSDMTQPDVTTTDTADAADTTVEDSADTTIDTVNDTEDSGGDTIVPTDSEDAADETTPDTADTTDTVVTGCTKHDDCPALQLCNFGNGTCIEPTVCFADEDCIQARVCADGYCDANYGGCTQATECTPTGGTCDPVAHQCVDNNDKDASGECKTDDDCIGNRRCVLVTTKKRCRDCSSSPDCPFNATCNANFCENFQYPAITPDDCESNNTPQTAKLVDSECNLGSDKTIDATDEDWYKVVVQPGETLLVRINYDNSNGRVRLELTNESGQFVYDRVTQAYRWSAAAYHLPTSASGPETVLIHVKLTFGYVPKYTLSYQRHPKKFCRNDSLEGKGGNDTPGTSTGIAAEETSLLFGGLQICPGDIDYYVFGVSDDGKDLTISIPTNGRGRIRAQLLDSTQKVISETVGDGTLQIIKPLLTKGLYYLRIRGVDAQGVDDDSVETLYGIDITLKTQACIDWLETDGGNNTLAKATGVTQKSSSSSTCESARSTRIG